MRWLAGLCWLLLSLPLIWICRAGLEALPVPGMDGEWGKWLRWGFSIGLTVADSVLILAWMATGQRLLLLGVCGVVAVSLALEALNIESGLKSADGVTSESAAIEAAAKARTETARAALDKARVTVARAHATRGVWERDGDKANDGTLVEAEHIQNQCADDLAAAETAYDLALREKERMAANRHPLAEKDSRTFFVCGGLLIIKALCWALCSVLHGPVRPGGAPLPSGGMVILPPLAPIRAGAPAFKPRKSARGVVAGIVSRMRA